MKTVGSLWRRKVFFLLFIFRLCKSLVKRRIIFFFLETSDKFLLRRVEYLIDDYLIFCIPRANSTITTTTIIFVT